MTVSPDGVRLAVVALATAAVVFAACGGRRASVPHRRACPRARPPRPQPSRVVAHGRTVRPWPVARQLRSWRAGRLERSAAMTELPEVIDLVRIVLEAGGNVRVALEIVAAVDDDARDARDARAERPGDRPVVAALRGVLAATSAGQRLGDSLGQLDALGEPARPLVDALLATERSGAPVVAALDRAAAEARTARRRQGEIAARRAPVLMLFPLVLCALPALGVLTIVPVLIRSFPSFTASP